MRRKLTWFRGSALGLWSPPSRTTTAVRKRHHHGMSLPRRQSSSGCRGQLLVYNSKQTRRRRRRCRRLSPSHLPPAKGESSQMGASAQMTPLGMDPLPPARLPRLPPPRLWLDLDRSRRPLAPTSIPLPLPGSPASRSTMHSVPCPFVFGCVVVCLAGRTPPVRRKARTSTPYAMHGIIVFAGRLPDHIGRY